MVCQRKNVANLSGTFRKSEKLAEEKQNTKYSWNFKRAANLKYS